MAVCTGLVKVQAVGILGAILVRRDWSPTAATVTANLISKWILMLITRIDYFIAANSYRKPNGKLMISNHHNIS